MNRSIISVRYAKAYVERARELGQLESADHDMRLLYTSLKQYPGFCQYILEHSCGNLEKITKIKSLYSTELSNQTYEFIQLVFLRKREEFLIDICRNAVNIIRKINGVIEANLSSAVVIDTRLRNQIREKFESVMGTSIELTTDIKPDIIGGFLLRINGLQYDASVATSLKIIKKQLFISNIS